MWAESKPIGPRLSGVSSFIVEGIDSAATLRTFKCAFVGVEIGVALLTTEQRPGAGLVRISEVQPFLFSRKANPAAASSAPLFYLKNLEKHPNLDDGRQWATDIANTDKALDGGGYSRNRKLYLVTQLLFE